MKHNQLPIAFSCLLLLRAGAAAQETAPPGELPAAPRPRMVSLEEAVQLALRNNLRLLSTVDVVESAEISHEFSRSRFGLKVTPSFERGFGSLSAVDQRYGVEVAKLLPTGTRVSASLSSDLVGNDLGNLTTSSFDVTVAQPLLRGFGPRSTLFDLQNARRSLQAAERGLDLARQRLAVDVVSGYYEILRQEGLVEVAEKAVERSRELLRASEARLEVGLASKLDVFRAELLLSQSEESLIIRREALELALDRFKFQLGLGPEDSVLLEPVEPEYQPADVDLDALTRRALAQRIELQEERDRIDDAKRGVAVSRQSLLPQLDLNLQYRQRGLGESIAESFGFQDQGVNVFFSTSYPLDRAAEAASLAQSQIDLEARRRSVRLTEYNIANEVRAAARNVERVGKSILLQERNIDFAEKQARLANLRYQRGLASNFDIIDAENNVIQARSSYVSLIADYHVALIELKRVTGVLDVEKEFAPGSFLPPARHHP